jgi:predicted PurR-regulated permease PerM
MNQLKQIQVNVTNRTIIRAVAWVVVAVIAFKIVHQLSHALTLIFMSFFLALALNPVVSWMSQKLRLRSRVRATAAAYLTIIVILIGFFTLVTPPLIHQTRDFINDFPRIVENFQNQNSSLARAVNRYHLDKHLTESAKEFASHYGNFGSAILDTGKRVISVVVSVLIVVVMTFMMLVEGPKWLEVLWKSMPKKKREHRKQLAYRIYREVSGFVNGQVILATMAGIFSFFALLIASNLLGVSINAAALAGIVAMLGLIPMIGNPISSTIVILVSLLSSPELAIIMLIYFFVYYHVENWTFQPYIQSRLNELSPLLVFISAIIGIELAGFLGAFVAIPTASAIKILIEDYFKNGRLEPQEEYEK